MTDHATRRKERGEAETGSFISRLDAQIAELLAAWPVDDSEKDDLDDEPLFPARRGGLPRRSDKEDDPWRNDTVEGVDISPREVYCPPDGYRRDRLGRWRYRDGGYVPGARDVTVGHLYTFHVEDTTCYVPTVLARTERVLDWARHYPLTTRGSLVCHSVPAGVWDAVRGYVVTLSAPELCADQLVDSRKLAELLGVRPASIAAYLHRGRLPQPVARIANSPVWTMPVLSRWMEARRRTG